MLENRHSFREYQESLNSGANSIIMQETKTIDQKAGSPHGRHRATGIVALAVIASRILGLAREMIFAAMFGAGRSSAAGFSLQDSFLAAFQIPNLLRDMFAEGALSTSFTTVFAKTHEKEGAGPSWRLTSLLLSTVVIILGSICILGIIASPILVHITNFGFHHAAGKFELTVRLTRIMFPFILFVSIAAIIMGILNARFVFGLPASASSVFNIVSVLAGVGLAFVFDPQADWQHPHFSERALYGVSLGVLLGGLAQAGVQLPTLWKLGFRFRWRLDFSDPGLHQVWTLLWPGVIAAGAVQANVLINGMFASEIDGARSWLAFAFRLMYLPIGVFGVAIATVTLPAVARHHARSDLPAFGKTVEESLRLAFYLTVPASVGLFVLAPDLIRIIYQHGSFSANDTIQTATALRAYTLGLAGYAAIRVLVPCFSALGQPRTPLKVSLFAIAVNITLNLILVKTLGMGHVGLAVTTSALALVNFAQLAFYLGRRVNLGPATAWLRLAGSVGAGAILCGTACLAIRHLAAPYAAQSLMSSVLALVMAVTGGVLVYFGATISMKTSESLIFRHAFLSILRRLG